MPPFADIDLDNDHEIGYVESLVNKLWIGKVIKTSTINFSVYNTFFRQTGKSTPNGLLPGKFPPPPHLRNFSPGKLLLYENCPEISTPRKMSPRKISSLGKFTPGKISRCGEVFVIHWMNNEYKSYKVIILCFLLFVD